MRSNSNDKRTKSNRTGIWSHGQLHNCSLNITNIQIPYYYCYRVQDGPDLLSSVTVHQDMLLCFSIITVKSLETPKQLRETTTLAGSLPSEISHQTSPVLSEIFLSTIMKYLEVWGHINSINTRKGVRYMLTSYHWDTFLFYEEQIEFFFSQRRHGKAFLSEIRTPQGLWTQVKRRRDLNGFFWWSGLCLLTSCLQVACNYHHHHHQHYWCHYTHQSVPHLSSPQLMVRVWYHVFHEFFTSPTHFKPGRKDDTKNILKKSLMWNKQTCTNFVCSCKTQTLWENRFSGTQPQLKLLSFRHYSEFNMSWHADRWKHIIHLWQRTHYNSQRKPLTLKSLTRICFFKNIPCGVHLGFYKAPPLLVVLSLTEMKAESLPSTSSTWNKFICCFENSSENQWRLSVNLQFKGQKQMFALTDSVYLFSRINVRELSNVLNN